MLVLVLALAIGVALLRANNNNPNSAEEIEDVVGAFLRPSTNITLTYD